MSPESQNFPPVNSPVQLEPLRKHTRLSLLVLALILVGVLAVGYFWYQNEQSSMDKFIPDDSGLETRNLSVASSTNQFTDWKTYRNEKYGFEFKYPNNAQVSISDNGKLITGSQEEGEFNSVIINFYNFDSFNSALSDGAIEEQLKYDGADNQWQVGHNSDISADEAFCPYERTTNIQKVPYYQIGDFRTGRLWNFAYVTKKGIIVISEVDGYIPSGVKPADIKFDNPKDVLSVGCIIGVNFKD